MNTVLWIFIAFAFGLLMFVSLQDKLPDELGFLKSKGVISQGMGETPENKPKEYLGWIIRQDNGAIELLKKFDGEGTATTRAITGLEIGILCAANAKLDMRVNTQLSTTGTKTTPISINNTESEMWQKGTSKNIFPTNPREVLGKLLENKKVSFTVSYVDAGLQTFQLDTTGLPPLISQLSDNCKP